MKRIISLLFFIVFCCFSTFSLSGCSKNELDKLSKDLGEVRKQVNSGKGYVQLDNNDELKKLIEELRRLLSGQLKGEVLQNIEGRYNKDDMKMLCDELDHENGMALSSKQPLNLSRACQNFVRRQMGYPAEYDVPTIKETNELIPLLNRRSEDFAIDNKELIN